MSCQLVNPDDVTRCVRKFVSCWSDDADGAVRTIQTFLGEWPDSSSGTMHTGGIKGAVDSAYMRGIAAAFGVQRGDLRHFSVSRESQQCSIRVFGTTETVSDPIQKTRRCRFTFLLADEQLTRPPGSGLPSG